MRKIQVSIDKWIESYGGYWKPLSMLARLQEEVGEVARVLNIKFGEKKIKIGERIPDLSKEVVDVVVTSIMIANSFNIDLEREIHDRLNIYSNREDALKEENEKNTLKEENEKNTLKEENEKNTLKEENEKRGVINGRETF